MTVTRAETIGRELGRSLDSVGVGACMLASEARQSTRGGRGKQLVRLFDLVLSNLLLLTIRIDIVLSINVPTEEAIGHVGLESGVDDAETLAVVGYLRPVAGHCCEPKQKGERQFQPTNSEAEGEE